MRYRKTIEYISYAYFLLMYSIMPYMILYSIWYFPLWVTLLLMLLLGGCLYGLFPLTGDGEDIDEWLMIEDEQLVFTISVSGTKFWEKTEKRLDITEIAKIELIAEDGRSTPVFVFHSKNGKRFYASEWHPMDIERLVQDGFFHSLELENALKSVPEKGKTILYSPPYVKNWARPKK